MAQHSPPGDDAQLVARLKAYDDDAVSEVVQRYGTALYRYIYTIVGDHHTAEDLVSETYLRMIEHIATFTYQGVPLRAWLYRIAHNLAINAVTRQQRHTVELTFAHPAPSNDGNPETLLGVQQEHEALRRALSALTAEQQQVLRLRFVGGFSLAETARVLERSEGAIKQLQHRALRTLSRLLEQNSDG